MAKIWNDKKKREKDWEREKKSTESFLKFWEKLGEREKGRGEAKSRAKSWNRKKVGENKKKTDRLAKRWNPKKNP